MKVLIIAATVIIFVVLLINWLSKSQIGTLSLFHSTLKKRLQRGDSPESACRHALNRIAHRRPIGNLTEVEIARIAQAFSRFKDPHEVNVLLKEALATGKIELLRDPYLSRLENVGREKGLTDG